MIFRKSVPKLCGRRPRSRNQNNRLWRLNSGTVPAGAFNNFWELKPPKSSAPDNPGSKVGGTTSSVWLDTDCLKSIHACPNYGYVRATHVLPQQLYEERNENGPLGERA